MSETTTTGGRWAVLHQYVAPIDPDYGGAPAKVTLWLDNLGGLVLGMDEGDGAKVIAQPLPRVAAQELGAALRFSHLCDESITGSVYDDCVRQRGHGGSHRTRDGRGFSR